MLHTDGHIRMADFGLSKQSENQQSTIQIVEKKSKYRNPFSVIFFSIFEFFFSSDFFLINFWIHRKKNLRWKFNKGVSFVPLPWLALFIISLLKSFLESLMMPWLIGGVLGSLFMICSFVLLYYCFKIPFIHYF